MTAESGDGEGDGDEGEGIRTDSDGTRSDPLETASLVPFDPPLALASLSGESDADWARAGARYAGAAFLGGIALDEPSRDAARELVARDRNEFLPEDPIAWIDRQLAALADVSIQPAVNVRATDRDALADAARVCASHDAILEVNAHCRQDELKAVGCGETLLTDTPRLAQYVRTAADAGATVSVKVRAEVDGVDLAATTRAVVDAGASIVHVDAMDSEHLVADVADAVSTSAPSGASHDEQTPDQDAGAARRPIVIANNGVRGPQTVAEYRAYGADAVSVGRPSTDPAVLERIHAALRPRARVED